jgi:uncharacterized protein YfaS (alpha-2-macroglobulin family)
MRLLWARLAFLLLIIGPIAASAEQSPSVLDATAGTESGTITRFTLRFSEPIAALGSRESPIGMKCSIDGEGRWVDATSFVWEFARGLPGDTLCTATLRPGLKTVKGTLVGGRRIFTIDSGGPFARAVLPYEGDSNIDEDQVFFVAANSAVDRASVAAGAYCAVDGIGERIPVDLLPAGTVERVLNDLGDHWPRRNFLENAGVGSDMPTDTAGRPVPLSTIIALKCRRPLPPGRDMSLVWGKSIKSPSGHLAGEEKRFDFTVREEFTARLTCGRVNAQAGCDPVEPFKVRFTAPVPRDQALAVRIEAGGKSFRPKDEGHEATLTDVRFDPPLPPGTTAQLIIPAGLRDEGGRSLANAQRFPLEFRIDQAPPLVKFAAPFGILEAKQGGVLPVTVRAVESTLAQSIKTLGGGTSRIEADDGVVAEWVRRIDEAQEEKYEDEEVRGKTVSVNHTGEKPLFSRSDEVERMQLALPAGGKDFEVVGIPLSRPGFYVVELASPELGAALLGRKTTRYVSAAALVTDMAVHFKWGRGASLVWVTSLDEGKPIGGALVRVTDSCTGRELARGMTDKYGRMMVPAGLPEPTTTSRCRRNGSDDDSSPPLMVSARKGEDFSFLMTNWGDGIRPYDFDLPYGWSRPEAKLHTIMDRALLRAGETIHMKHVYRMPTQFGFRSGGAVDGTLVLQHRGSETKYEIPLHLGADGIGESEWTPPKGSPMGDYEIRAKVGDDTIDTGQSFRVDEYRLPMMRASVSGPRATLVRPKNVPVDLFVGYLSGGGATRAPVKVRTAYELLYDNPDGWDGWTFGGRPVREGTVALDEEENEPGPDLPAASTLPLTLDQHGALRTPVDVPMLQDAVSLRVEMDYQDASGETLTASSSIPLYASSVRLGIKPDGWLQRDNHLRLKVVALGLDGKAIRRQRVDVDLYTREILSVRRRLIGGFYAFENSAKTTKIAAHCSNVTDGQGLVTCKLDPGVSGEVIAVATTHDSGGNEARTVTSIYLAGDDDWWFGGDNGDRMDIIADAKSYKPGDKARVQVRMPFREATALVTVEREGVLSSFVTELSGKDPVIDVPLAGNAAPDAFISVIAVRGRIPNWRVWVTKFAQRWHLPFLANLEQPTAIVDLAKPSYRVGMTKVRVGWDSHRLKVGVRAEKSQYRVREKARVEVEVRGPDGKVPQGAEVAFAAVDEALLQLEPNESWNILDAMMEERPLSVLTSTAQMQVVGKRHYGRKALASGGGGGGDLSALTRADFRPVLLWKGRVTLDARGKAVLEVPMADSLSSYRLVAIATAGDELFGTGSTEVRTVQDLTVYAGVPPLVRSGDTYLATFTLRNGTEQPMTVTADAAVEPAVPLQGGPQTVTIEPGGAMPVSWQVTAPEGAEQMRWTVSARTSNGRSADRIRVDEQVIPAVPVEAWAASFLRVDPAVPIPLAAPAGSLPGRGGIEVALSATPAPELIGVRDYMRRYPFGCFEQRLSKAIALDDHAAWNKQVEDLPLFQATDGLLLYWPGDSPRGSIALTAYTLSITAEARWPLPEAAKKRMIEALRGVVDGRVKHEGQDPADARLLRLYALAALARNGAATPAMLSQVAMPLRDMPTFTLADWLVTLDKVRGVNPALRTAAEAALRSRVVYEGRRLDLVDAKASPWWMMVNKDGMAIHALLAVIGRRGWDQDAPRMMIGVALRQSRGHWDTTTANAWGTLAVRRFQSAFSSPTGGVTRATFGSFHFERPWGDAVPMRFPLPAAQTMLQLSHSTQPPPWATILVRAAVPLKAPLFSGYRLNRQISFVERHSPNQLSRGDVLKVRITVDAPVDRTWVVIEDPIPAGSSVISGGGTQSRILAEKADGDEGAWPSYIERGFDSWRAYFEWMPQGRTSIEYIVRINNVGRFQMSPTRVEAMYSPEIHGALPNQAVVVAP